MTKQAVWAVVPAAGVGSRMQADRPKQYLSLGAITVLEQTLQRLASHPDIAGIVVAISDDDLFWQGLALELDCELITVSGGKERYHSVLNALTFLTQHLDYDPWVLVHDAARPCLRHQDIDLMLAELQDHQVGGILGIPVTDTVKRVDEQQVITDTVCRQGLWRAATPQMFRSHALRDAIEQAKDQINVTDEASAMEYIGMMPKMVAGHADNIKITVPQDLALAKLFLQQQQEGL
jgi:2-C-methyl-D-erythritol 4-phosphate cytidylyltransferase